MGAGMLGPDVEKHEIAAVSWLRCIPHSSGLKRNASCFELLPVRRASVKGSISVARAGWSFRSGCPSQVGGMQYPFQMRMPVEANPEHVPHLAFIPVRRGPQIP